MNTLNIQVGKLPAKCRLLIGGEEVALTKSPNSDCTAKYVTANDNVEITFYKPLETASPLWLLWGLLFFFISGLGIFNPFYDRKCQIVKYRLRLTLSGYNNVRLDFGSFQEGQRAVFCQCDCYAEEYENLFTVDTQAKKRLKILTLIKALIWVAAVIAAVLTVIFVVII